MKIPCQIKEFCNRGFELDRLVFMAVICYSAPISAVPINDQLLGEKKTCVKLQTDISKTEGLAYIQTHGHGYISSARYADHL